MKRKLSVLLAAIACFALVGCEEEPAPAPAPAPAPEHEHTWATEWSKDGDNHWLACTGEDCEEIKDKAGHEWNAGEITTQPSASADGVKTYTCTVCSQTKTETVPYVVDTEVTAEEWLAALSFTGENNYKIASVATGLTQYVEYDGTTARIYGVSPMGDAIEQFYTKEGEAYAYYSVFDGKIERTPISETEYNNAKSLGLDTMFLFTAFTYDPTSKTYKASEISYGNTLFYTNVEVAVENGRLVRMTYDYSFDGSAPFATTTTVTYGGVQTIAIPTNTVDETQMLAAFADAKNDAISKRVTLSLGGDTMIFITNADKYSYSMPNVSEYVLVIDGLKIYNRTYDEDTSAWGAWEMQTVQSETSFMQSYEYMHKPNLFLKYYAPTSFASMTQAQDGGYEYTIQGNNDYGSYKVYFVNGKLTKFVIYDGGDAYTLNYEYGDYTVEIPQEQ